MSGQQPSPWTWSQDHGDHYRTERQPNVVPRQGEWKYIWARDSSAPRTPFPPRRGEGGLGGIGGTGSTGGGGGGEQPLEPYGARNATSYTASRAPTSSLEATTASFARLGVSGPGQHAIQEGPVDRLYRQRTESQASGGSTVRPIAFGAGSQQCFPAGRDLGFSTSAPQQSTTYSGFNEQLQPQPAQYRYGYQQGPSYLYAPPNPMRDQRTATYGYTRQPQQYQTQTQSYQAQHLPHEQTADAKDPNRSAGKQAIRDKSHFSDVEVSEDLSNSLIRGTPREYEVIDPSYRVINPDEEWKFFVRGRVFQMLLIENASERVQEGKHISLLEFNGAKEKVFARISRFVIVEAKCKRHYSKCIPISTYNYHATGEKSKDEQQEHGIIFTSNRVPPKLPKEKHLRKDPVKVDLLDPTLKLAPESRVDYAFTRPIQHNVKVKCVGMVSKADLPKLVSYWKQY